MISDFIVKNFLSLLQTAGGLFGFFFCGFVVGLVCFFLCCSQKIMHSQKNGALG